jgi:type IV/VI secretion system ImpK/VasF family protein
MERIKLLPLLKLCEPIFTCVCELRVKTDKLKGDVTYESTHRLVEDLLNKVESDLQYATPLWRQYRRIEVALLCFIDFMICESSLLFTDEWDRKRMAYAKGEMAGDYKFFEIFKEIYIEYSVDSEDCLTFFYYCLHLGFTGVYKHRPEEITKINKQIEDRVPRLKKLKKKSYLGFVFEHVDSRNVMPKRWLNIKRILWIIILLSLLYILFNMFLYNFATAPLFIIFEKILNM